MEMLRKQRLATDNEKSLKVKFQGYDPKKCAGKCIIHSYAHPEEAASRKPIFVVNGIEHKCKKKE